MSENCCADHPSAGAHRSASYRRVLWAALAINASMFLIELGAGLAAQSVSLQADALDFFSDAVNYGISLAVLGMAGRWRARAALFKGLCMAGFGAWIVAASIWNAAQGTVPAAPVMGIVGAVALAANLAVLGLLLAWREGDANMRSVWICSRNDVLGNIAVLAAALGVFGVDSGWPDIAVAAIMAALALGGGWQIALQARRELRPPEGLAA